MDNNTLTDYRQKTTFNYDGNDADKFIKQIIRMLYDAEIEDVVFKNGNNRDVRKENVWIKCM
jgi:hypothetical protein